MYSFLILRDRSREHFCDGYIVTGLLKNEILEFHEYASQRSRPITLFGHTELQDVDCIDVDNIRGSEKRGRSVNQGGPLPHWNDQRTKKTRTITADRYAGYE